MDNIPSAKVTTGALAGAVVLVLIAIGERNGITIDGLPPIVGDLVAVALGALAAWLKAETRPSPSALQHLPIDLPDEVPRRLS